MDVKFGSAAGRDCAALAQLDQIADAEVGFVQHSFVSVRRIARRGQAEPFGSNMLHQRWLSSYALAVQRRLTHLRAALGVALDRALRLPRLGRLILREGGDANLATPVCVLVGPMLCIRVQRLIGGYLEMLVCGIRVTQIPGRGSFRQCYPRCYP